MSRKEMESKINNLGEPWIRFMRQFEEERRRATIGYKKLGILSEATISELVILDERNYDKQLAELIKLARPLEDARAGRPSRRERTAAA